MTAALSAYPPAVWALLLGTSVLIGLLAGLLGVGGGIVAVPALLDVFSIMGLDEANAVVLAVGTAQASILVASLSAVVAHWRAGTIDGRLVRAWLPALFAGTLLGLALSVLAPAKLLTGLFAAIYKVLPDTPIAWRDVVIGALVTAGLFEGGKYVIALYIGKSDVASSYGAAGALIILLLWIFYSAQIFLLGAEFTRAFARRYGTHVGREVSNPIPS